MDCERACHELLVRRFTPETRARKQRGRAPSPESKDGKAPISRGSGQSQYRRNDEESIVIRLCACSGNGLGKGNVGCGESMRRVLAHLSPVTLTPVCRLQPAGRAFFSHGSALSGWNLQGRLAIFCFQSVAGEDREKEKLRQMTGVFRVSGVDSRSSSQSAKDRGRHRARRWW